MSESRSERERSAATGALLRNLGLLIELPCVLALLSSGEERRIGGVSIRTYLIGGVVFGFVLWAVGTVIRLGALRRAREPR